MNTINFCILIAMCVYLLMMLAIGFIFSKNNGDSTVF